MENGRPGDGEKSLCFNIWLERPLLWLAGVNLVGLNGISGAELELSYELELRNS